MDNPITRSEHEEFRRRMEEQHRRTDKRLELLEETVTVMNTLTVSVERLATSMESMLKEQERQGQRLETLEGRDGEMWRKVVGYVATAIAGIIVGWLFTQGVAVP